MIDPRTLPVRFSRLKKIGQSPAHYLHACQDNYEQSSWQQRGSLTHAVIFGTPYCVFDGERRAGAAWKAFQEATAANIPICKQSELVEAEAMRDQVHAHPLASSLLKVCTTIERRIDWDRDGRACSGTPDAHGDGILVDLKTTRRAEPEWFLRDVKRYAYFAQLAWYASALNATGHDIRELYVIAVESAAPYPVTVVQIRPSAWIAGEALLASWWERLRQCERDNEWPGYTNAAVPFDVDDDISGITINGDPFDF